MYQTIRYEVKEGIAYVTINRPEALNALNKEVLSELKEAFGQFEQEEEAKVAIVTGEGKAFVAGADIAQMSKMTPTEGRAMMLLGQGVMNQMEAIEKPIIAAVNGFALGGGCELSMACDIRIASEKAKFAQPEVALGVIPGFGGTQRLPRLVGRGMGKYLTMTAEMIDAAEAYRIGLVEKVVAPEELMNTAQDIARNIMAKAPLAIGVAKKVINSGYDMDLRSGCSLEAEAMAALFGSEDKKEGMAAFLEKRDPDFKRK